MNLLIKGECEKCGATVQYVPEEGSQTSYKNTCLACGNETGLTVSPQAAPKAATSTKAPATT